MGRRLELLRVETASGRRYLRLTRLAVLLIVGLTAVAMAAIIVLFLSGRSSLRTPARIELKAPEPTPFNVNSQVIKPLPPPTRRPTPQPTQGRISTAPSPEGRNLNAGSRATPERPEKE